MCGYFCIGFTNFVLKGNGFLGYTNSFFSKKYEKNDKIMLQYFE